VYRWSVAYTRTHARRTQTDENRELCLYRIVGYKGHTQLCLWTVLAGLTPPLMCYCLFVHPCWWRNRLKAKAYSHILTRCTRCVGVKSAWWIHVAKRTGNTGPPCCCCCQKSFDFFLMLCWSVSWAFSLIIIQTGAKNLLSLLTTGASTIAPNKYNFALCLPPPLNCWNKQLSILRKGPWELFISLFQFFSAW
jgi:hypothetical protein